MFNDPIKNFFRMIWNKGISWNIHSFAYIHIYLYFVITIWFRSMCSMGFFNPDTNIHSFHTTNYIIYSLLLAYIFPSFPLFLSPRYCYGIFVSQFFPIHLLVMFCLCLDQSSLNPPGYKLHSFSIVIPSWAFTKGVSVVCFQNHDRWKPKLFSASISSIMCKHQQLGGGWSH